MSDFLHFCALIGTELYDLFVHFKSGRPDTAEEERLAARIARKTSDEMARREIEER